MMRSQTSTKMINADVFRFKCGATCYILHDEYKHVFVHDITNKIFNVGVFTDVLHEFKAVEIKYVDPDGKKWNICVFDFYDEFEAKEFMEFMKQFIKKMDSDTKDHTPNTDKDV